MSYRDDAIELIKQFHLMISEADRGSLNELNLIRYELEALLVRAKLRVKMREENLDNM